MFGRKNPWQHPKRQRNIFRSRKTRDSFTFASATLRRNAAIRPAQRPANPSPEVGFSDRVIGTPARIRRSRSRLALILSNAALACSIGFFWPAAMGTVDHSRNQIWGLDKTRLKNALSEAFGRNERPGELLIETPDIRKTGHIHYSIDPVLQSHAEQSLAKFRPDYGMIVAMDATSGEILAMADIRRDGVDGDNLNLQATYPAASVFKTITAAAAIDMGKANAGTVIPYNGKSTTLYKKNVLRHRNNKWTNHRSLEKSFSKSVNTVFARLGIYTVGGDELLNYADRFAFNQQIGSDLPLQPSTIEMNPDDEWSIAEVASGYTRGTNISPVHGAMIAAAVANGGRMPTPHIIDAVTDEHGIILFENDSGETRQVISADAAAEMKKLMNETIRSGSAAKSFRKFPHKTLDAGGKTGSLTGFNPKGKYDWFVGYADDGERKLAYAVLCINKEFWYVKSAHLARTLIEKHFSS